MAHDPDWDGTNEYNDRLRAIHEAVAAERARCVQAIKDCPSLDENGYVCQKADAISEILRGL